MNTQKSTDCRWSLRTLFGITLCSLLFFFAVAAKLSLYHPEQAKGPLSATKIWQVSQEPTVKGIAQLETAEPFTWLALAAISFAPVFVVLLSTVEQTPEPIRYWFSPSLAVRPPPAV